MNTKSEKKNNLCMVTLCESVGSNLLGPLAQPKLLLDMLHTKIIKTHRKIVSRLFIHTEKAKEMGIKQLECLFCLA